MNGRLAGRTALVTGASRGLGAAMAERFAEEGCEVALNFVAVPDRDNAAEAEAVAARIEALGRRALCLEADVTDADAVEGMVAAALEAFGRLDILVNNAGINRDRTLRKLERPDWDAVLAVNLTGPYVCSRAVLEPMRERGYGRIVSIASVVGQMGNFGQTNYAASKAGLIGFTKSLAREVARYGITANAIAPGFIETEMTAGMPEEARGNVLTAIPVGRLGRPEDVAEAALFLASEAAAYVTGQVIGVNGGLYM
jgi:3-oxoacyl-[acyl-carrier protein] reductase